MIVALLWFCTGLHCASRSTHQSCVKDTLASTYSQYAFLSDIKCINICSPLFV